MLLVSMSGLELGSFSVVSSCKAAETFSRNSSEAFLSKESGVAGSNTVGPEGLFLSDIA